MYLRPSDKGNHLTWPTSCWLGGTHTCTRLLLEGLSLFSWVVQVEWPQARGNRKPSQIQHSVSERVRSDSKHNPEAPRVARGDRSCCVAMARLPRTRASTH